MTIDSQSIEAMLRQIAQGQLDPHQAARRVLGLEAAPPAPSQIQTLDSLVRRLGAPPPEIERDWRLQIEGLAQHWQQVHRRPLPALQLSDLLVDAENRLSLRPDVPSPEASLTLGEITPQDPAPVSDPVVTPAEDQTLCSRPPARRRRAGVAAAALVTCAAATALWFALPRGDSHRGSPPSDSDHRDDALAFSPASPARHSGLTTLQQDQPRAGGSLTPDPPANLPQAPDDSLRHAEPGWNDPLLADVLLDLDLPRASTPELADEPPPQDAGEPPALATDADVPLEIQGSSGEERPTRSAAASMGLTLAPLPSGEDASHSELIFESAVSELHWDFPVPTSLVLRTIGADRWALVDTLDDTELALLASSDDGLRFQWSDHAASNPSARQIAAGRLHLAGPSLKPQHIATHADASVEKITLWLRPQLRAEPLRIDFSDAQTTTSWPLEGPPIFPGGELSVDVDVPDSVQMDWVEPLDPQNLRRSVSLLQWTPAGAAAPAIRCRIELRATTQLFLKLRYAVQLDESLPWQPFSPRQWTRATDRLTVLLNRALVQQSELARQYSVASTTGKRLIKPAKDALDQNVRRMQTLAQRIGQLDALQASLAAEAEFRIALTTQWPDGRQTILDMTPED